MKTLFIIFGLLYAVNCKPAEMDPIDYLDDGQNDNEEYPEGEDEDTNAANEQEEVYVITKEETFIRNLADSVLLPCVFSGNNDYVRLWKKNEVILYQAMVKMGASNTSQELPNGTLNITNLEAKDDGQYVCSALVYADKEKNPKVTHTLKIRVPPQIKSLTARDNITTIKSGETLFLSCQATGYPEPIISWHKGGERLSGTGENFTLKNIKHHNAGQYSCLADNHVPPKPAVKVINIKVEYKPEMIIDQINVNSVNNQDIELNCIVHAEPSPTVVWKKDGVNIKNSHRHQLSSTKKSHILLIKSLEESDFGVYTCSATNYLGVKSKNITLVKTPVVVRFLKPKSDHKEPVLAWEVQSNSPITENELQYRKKGESNWRNIKPEASNAGNALYTVKHTFKGLGPGDYETRIKSYNAHGWSEYSEIETFGGVHAKNGHHKSHKKPHSRDGKDKQIASTPEPDRPTEPSQNTGEPAEHYEVTSKKPQVGATESSGCSSLTATVTLNVALVVIFLVRPPTIRI